MSPVQLSNRLRKEYGQLFDTCSVREEKLASVDALVDRVLRHRDRYMAVEEATGVPWHVVSVVHAMESSLNLSTHLHNGDPLTARTVHVPRGRPREGSPPFTWLESAIDALTFQRLHQWRDWGLSGTLYKLEQYNGMGYRQLDKPIRSPYLWSFSNHYVKGKYTADGVYSKHAVSRQCGAAVLLRRLLERGEISLTSDAIPPADPVLTERSRDRYTVRRGDSLWTIARRKYGDGKRWPAIARANGINPSRPRYLRPHEVLVIPALKQLTPEAKARNLAQARRSF